MNRYLFPLAALFGALMPLVFDSAFKGAVLLATAALVAIALWRASAAARHLVWLVAIVALLVVPLLSLALPQWRVLPQWAGGTVAVRAEDRPYTPYRAYRAYEEPTAIAEDPAPEENPAPTTATTPANPPPTAHLPLPTPPAASPTWREWLPFAWCAGFALLIVRLLAAHLLLRCASRQCPALTAPPDEKIAAAFADACARLGIRQRVTLLFDKKRTIPVVWGVFRPRLMLPLEAREWSDEQLCSVLLHELGHIKRRDTLVQWLTQIACALHWWNPLVWLAAWRLHAERERACDDLVLASGVRPSDYAEHLLDVATRLSPARWTSACGLAMARKSSLEGRLMAVLSEKLNRNGVTRALAIAALVLGAAIALPVAMLRAADEQWNPPQAANIGTNDFTTYCVHDGKSAAYIIAYHGIFGSSSEHTSNSKTRTWRDAATLTLETPAGKKNIEFHREHTAPNKLTLAETEYDLANGHLFLINAEGTVRQLDQKIEVVENSEGAAKLKKQIDEIPPQVRESVEAPMAGALTIATTDINAVVSPVAGKAIAFEIGSGEDKRIVVHSARADAEDFIIRCDADDRGGRWWNQIKLINDGHPESSFPILPDGWLPKGKFTFLEKADDSLTFAEVVSGDVRTPVRIRLATPGEMSGGNSGAPHPKTSPSAAVYLDERIYSLKGDALDRAKTVPLPAALDIIGGGRMISRPMVVSTKRNGPHYHPTEATLDVVTKIVPGGVKVVGSVSFRFPEAKYASAFDASRARSEQGPFKEISAPVDAMLGLNDALVVPLASPEHFPEPLVAYITAIARPVARASWTPPANRPPLEADGWVLKWPRSDDKWFRSLFDYEGFPELLESALERRSAPPANGVWSETISSLNRTEVEKLVARFRAQGKFMPVRVEPFKIAKPESPHGFTSKDRTPFVADGEHGAVSASIDSVHISPAIAWDKPLIPNAGGGYGSHGIRSGDSIAVLLPGLADAKEIRMLVLRCTQPNGPSVLPQATANPPKPSVPAVTVVPNPKPTVTFTNSLGMDFVRSGSVDFARNLVRVKDYELFAAANPGGGKLQDPGFPQTPDHPVVNVTWENAIAFCEWLTKLEREKGVLKPDEAYRLPTDLEWSTAAGIPPEKGATPEARDLENAELFAWGTAWPPPPGVGNYAGEETKSEVRLQGYRDDFPWTSPVGSFQPNALGLFDMGGNVWQWMMDDFNESKERKVLRGGSWYNGGIKQSLLLSCRYGAKPEESNDTYGFRIVKASIASNRERDDGDAPKRAEAESLWDYRKLTERKPSAPSAALIAPDDRSNHAVELDAELVAKLERRATSSIILPDATSKFLADTNLDEAKDRYEAMKRLFEAGSIPSQVYYGAQDSYFAALRERSDAVRDSSRAAFRDRSAALRDHYLSILAARSTPQSTNAKHADSDDTAIASEAASKASEKTESAAAPSLPALRATLRADLVPIQARQWNDKYAAVAYQTQKDVNFVLIHEGFISTGLSESSADNGKWSIEGNIHLVDAEKTKAAGKNVDKRKVVLKYRSDAPGTLILDGKEYDLNTKGRVFILRDQGEPEQLDKTMPLRDKADLEKLGALVKKLAAAKPDGAQIRTAVVSGRYKLDDDVSLILENRTIYGAARPSAEISFAAQHNPLDPTTKIIRDENGDVVRIDGPTEVILRQGYTIELARGVTHSAFAWESGSRVLWLSEDGALRRFDIDDRSKVKETKFAAVADSEIPAAIEAELTKALNAPRPESKQPEAPKTGALKPADAKIQPGDLLHFRFEPLRGLDGRFAIDADGKVKIPGLGTHAVAGMSLAESGEYLRKATAKNLAPIGVLTKVTVAYAGGPKDFVVYLDGEFEKPRIFIVPEAVPRTALAIINAAGGSTKNGDVSAVRIRTDFTWHNIVENRQLIDRNGKTFESSVPLNANRARFSAVVEGATDAVDLTEVRNGTKPDVPVPHMAIIVIPSIEDTRKLKPGESFTLTVPPPLNYTDAAEPPPAFPKDGLKLTVNPYGKLVDPAFGELDVTGRPLQEIRKELLARIALRLKLGKGMSDAAFNALWIDWKKEQAAKPANAKTSPPSQSTPPQDPKANGAATRVLRDDEKILPGDTLNVFTPGNPPAKESVAVTDEKFVTLSALGRIEVADKNVEEVRKMIAASYGKATPDLREQITVSFARESNLRKSGDLILPGDNLAVLVEPLREYSGRFIVRRGHYIIMPGIGRIVVAGKTTDEATKAIKEQLVKSAPGTGKDIDVKVSAFEGSGIRDHLIFLAGEFVNPGGYGIQIEPRPTLGSVMKTCGGVTKNGDTTQVQVFAARVNPEPVIVDLADIDSGKRADIEMIEGMVIVVPPKVPGMTLKPGDSFSVTIPKLAANPDIDKEPGAPPPELNLTVSEKGTVEHSSFGKIYILGMTEKQLRGEIAKRVDERRSPETALLEIQDDGSILLAGKPVTIEQAIELVKARVAAAKENNLPLVTVLRAEKNVPASKVKAVASALTSAGIGRLSGVPPTSFDQLWDNWKGQKHPVDQIIGPKK